MSLDTVSLLQDMQSRKRERGRFDFQRVALDSVMAVGLVGVSWIAVKAGLALNDLSKVVQDPLGAADDAARDLLIAEKRIRLKELRIKAKSGMRTGLAREGSIAALLGAKTLESEVERIGLEIVAEESVLRGLEGERMISDSAEDAPGIPLLRTLDTYLNRYGPVAPAGITGSMILMEMLRVKRERERI
jgi:hypothetical protein